MQRYITLWVLLAALAGWSLAALFGDPAWTRPGAEVPAFYALVIFTKQAFLGLLKMLVAPVVFLSLLAGVVNLGSTAAMGRLGGGTALWYLGTTAIAAGMGLVVVLFIHPWTAFEGPHLTGEVVTSARLVDPDSASLGAVLTALARQALVNPVAALADLNIMAIVLNAILFGLAIVLTVPRDSPLISVIGHLTDAVYRVLGWLVLLMPAGVFAIVFDLTLGMSAALVPQLLAFVAVVVGVTLLHGLVVLPLLAWLLTGIKPLALLRALAQPLIVAFSTSSSAATLPVSLKTAQERLGIRRPIAAFVLPLGATMNMDGTALFEGIAALFLAWLFGIELNTLAVLVVFLTAMLSSIGAPGMPSGSMAGMQLVLLAAGIPLEAIGVLLLVERPLDTIRTAVNVEGDLIGSLVMQRFMPEDIPQDAAA